MQLIKIFHFFQFFFCSKTKFVLSIYYSQAANSKQAILMECTSIRECKIRIKMAEPLWREQNAHLIHEMLKCRCMVNWSVVIKIGVEREVTECFPWRLKTGDFYAVEVERGIVSHRRARYHRDTLQAVVAHFTPLLWNEKSWMKKYFGGWKIAIMPERQSQSINGDSSQAQAISDLAFSKHVNNVLQFIRPCFGLPLTWSAGKVQTEARHKPFLAAFAASSESSSSCPCSAYFETKRGWLAVTNWSFRQVVLSLAHLDVGWRYNRFWIGV